ncbi:LutC/YkgG family protein [Desulfovibrio ferrophilus]|uniref:Lactate utilization protein B/C n=1 Tax=Desulfovibrio ferrophilus TaxID=241368 RepID=A0A2Z6B3F7_9BACT|nr:lactate utilization protein [Desulfovibrio ferrophilus]BBD10021.1 lactate utilization protein B/C [Desulfovibrio ferrophilus]
MTATKNVVETFTTKAGLVSAVVSEVKTLKEAYEYTVDLCDKKEMCQLLVSGCELNLSEGSEKLCEEKTSKIIAAPGMKKQQYSALAKLAEGKGFELIDSGLRKYLAGIDIGFTICDLGIAETGTLVLNSASEDVRLATMVAETHVAVLPKSKLRATSYDAEAEVLEFMKNIPNYLAFITGASRTADIERVLALGVHGPLELHILLWEDK